MAKYKLLLPKMGESVEEATIIRWTKNPGDYIEADETVMEIATDKVDSDVPSPVSGKLLEKLYKDNDVVKVGAAIAIIETGEPEAEPTPAPTFHQVQPPPVQDTPPLPETPAAQPVYETPAPAPVVFTPPTVPAAPAPQPLPVQHTPPPVPAPQPEPEQVEEPKAPVFTEQRRDYAEPVAVPYTEQLQQKAEDSTKSEGRFYSPLVKNIAAQEGISNAELDKIPGTGAEGRLTKDDLLAYVQQRAENTTQQVSQNGQADAELVEAPVAETPEPEPVPEPTPVAETPKPEPVAEAPKQEPVAEATKTEPAPTPALQPAAQPEPAEIKMAKGVSLSSGDEIIEMDRMRRLIADHMVMSKQTSPHVTSFVEADVTNLVLWREKIKSSFEKREGQKITFTPIFIEAVVRAIKDLPMINVQVNGNQIIKKKDINISMATALPSGNLIVPVIKRADELNLVGLTKAVNDLASRARENKLKPDDVQGGTFTLTNVGSFGNVMGTPIINQPQVAILAVGAIRKKPAVIETLQGDMIGIRHMMFLSLSYDHRVVDGALGGSFVRRVADYLENWETDREY